MVRGTRGNGGNTSTNEDIPSELEVILRTTDQVQHGSTLSIVLLFSTIYL